MLYIKHVSASLLASLSLLGCSDFSANDVKVTTKAEPVIEAPANIEPSIETPHNDELKGKAANAALFKALDKNGDDLVEASEVPGFDADFFEHGDRNLDERLSEKELGFYKAFETKVAQARKFIPKNAKVYMDIAYVENGHRRQKLDLYLAASFDKTKPLPLVIWIHGGSWSRGSKLIVGQQAQLLSQGYALASVNYRLSQHAHFPAQVNDSNAAIRFLRKNADKYSLDPERFGVWGSSAGGHIAALVGTGSDIEALQGDIGVTGVSSRVQAVAVWFGPTDMIKMYALRKSRQPAGKDLSIFPVHRLIGGSPSSHPQMYALSSSVNHVTSDDSPTLLMHADRERVVPLEQSLLLYARLNQMQVPTELHIVQMDKHAYFEGEEESAKVLSFFDTYLK